MNWNYVLSLPPRLTMWCLDRMGYGIDLTREEKSVMREMGWSVYRRRARRQPFGRVDRENILVIKDDIGIVVELEEWQ